MESTNDPPDPVEEPLPPSQEIPEPIPETTNTTTTTTTTTTTATVTRRIRRCGLCREPDHTIRTCPDIDVRHRAHLDYFLQFMLRHDICTKERAMRFRYPYLISRPTIELKCIARKYRHPVEIMDHRDMYRALKRNYIDTTISSLEDYYVQRSLQYYSQLYSTITFIERIIHRGGQTITREMPRIGNTNDNDDVYTHLHNNRLFQFNIVPKNYSNIELIDTIAESDDDDNNNSHDHSFTVQTVSTVSTVSTAPMITFDNYETFDCPICLEPIETCTKEIELNCTHRVCTECFRMYMQTIHLSVLNINEPVENAIPKCPLCRRIIHTLKGNRFIIEQTQQDASVGARLLQEHQDQLDTVENTSNEAGIGID